MTTQTVQIVLVIGSLTWGIQDPFIHQDILTHTSVSCLNFVVFVEPLDCLLVLILLLRVVLVTG